MAKEGKTGVLFLHGIQGRPEHFRFLIDALSEGIPYRAPLLPGHGKTVREFRRVGLKDWLDAARREARALADRCEAVVFVGHSLGCLLGLLTDEALGRPFAGMLLIGCPFRIRPTPRYFHRAVLAMRPESEVDGPGVKAARAANSVSARNAAAYLLCVRPYAGLLRAIRPAFRAAKTRLAPAEYFFSDRDEIVSLRSASAARRCAGADVTVLADCGHDWFADGAQALLKKRLRETLARAGGTVREKQRETGKTR